jgi:NAD(P)H-dependent FMN reductase
MKIAIITQSSEEGVNYGICNKIKEEITKENNNVVVIYENPQQIDYKSALSCDRIIMVIPEWNMSFPFTFKKMIDDSGWPSYFENKQIMLVGTSNTGYGNVLGIQHLMQILQFCKARVHPKLLTIPIIKERLEKDLPRILEEAKKFLK